MIKISGWGGASVGASVGAKVGILAGARPRRVVCTALCGLLPLVAAAAGAAERPRIGLVLGGGGARGAAHIGVLEVLDRLQVPVDCVAGTSMGALVAGIWAAGMSPAEMRSELARADWTDLFQDNPGYDELNFRTKLLSRSFLPGSESGVTEGGLVAPAAVVSGQKIKAFFNRLVRADTGQRDIADLPLPVSLIATDIGNGERVVFRSGSLSLAMRASMSVPGLLSPTTINGRKLVDGGLVDNLPVAEVRQRCQADVVIAVNVGSPLLKPEEVTGLLSISTQMINILTEQNVSQSRALLQTGDIYIRPDLEGLTAGDFQRSGEAADRGRAAAELAGTALSRLALPATEYAAWRDRMRTSLAAAPMIDAIEIAGLKRVAPETVSRYLQQQAGQPLDVNALDRGLLRAYGDGHFESVDYALLTLRDRRVLRITPIEKPWGPDYVRLGLKLEASYDRGSTYALRLGYQKTWINRLGGELLLSAQLGDSVGAYAQWYQPLDASQRFFVQADLSSSRESAFLYQDDRRMAQFRVDSGTLDLLAGVNIGLLGQARLGWRMQRRSSAVEIGTPIVPGGAFRSSGLLVAVDIDQLNRLYAPTSGWSVSGSWFDAISSSDAENYSKLNLQGSAAVPIGSWVVAGRVTYAGAMRGQLPPADAATLGGFLNLSAFANGQLFGDDIHYAHLRGERIIGRLPLGLRGDMRMGLAFEVGRVGTPYAELGRTGWLRSTTIYVGGETPFGPVYVGFARGSGGVTNAYLFIGTP